MKTLMEITDADFGLEPAFTDLPLRKAARAVIFNAGKIALMHIANEGYYKLPGGGMEAEDEDNWEIAAARESLEETGCIVSIREYIGQIVEYRAQKLRWNPVGVKQISYCGIADVVTDTGNFNLDEAEIEEGLTLIWVTLDEALQLSRNAKTNDYSGKFIQKRDLVFLEEAKKMLGM
jgi:8-oxo-dGTP diphosphatase